MPVPRRYLRRWTFVGPSWGDEYRVRVADVGEDQTGAKGSILHGSEDGASGHIVAVRYEFVRSSAAGQDV
ncbi:hypothetical protein QJQ45_005614 [Haematococcus lacustris]|nr:hypothetical protein QJQ45_005614 [Haematococcus lacustris]